MHNYTTPRETLGAGMRHNAQRDPAQCTRRVLAMLGAAPPFLHEFFLMTTKINRPQPPERLTGAELQTLREACNLSREDFAALAGVAARTVKHWESGRAGVPADVAELVHKLDATLDAAAAHALEAIHRVHLEQGGPAQDVVLLRYKTDADLTTHYTDPRKTSPAGDMPASLHGGIVGRTRLALRYAPQFADVAVRVVWFDADSYRAWLQAGAALGKAAEDSPTQRSTWAAQQVDEQAPPHRADQPPAA